MIDQITRNNCRINIYEILLKNRDYSLLEHDKLMEMLDNIENVILLMTQQEFISKQIRSNKHKLFNRIYINNYTYILGILEDNNTLITQLVKNIVDENLLYKKDLENIVNEKTKEIIIKQKNKKNIKVKITYDIDPCRFCGNKTIRSTTHTRCADECDVIVKKCDTCDKIY